MIINRLNNDERKEQVNTYAIEYCGLARYDAPSLGASGRVGKKMSPLVSRLRLFSGTLNSRIWRRCSQDIENQQPSKAASHTKRKKSSNTPLSKPQNSNYLNG